MELTLSNQQIKVWNMFCEGQNIFMTGPGGCGKSLMIQLINEYCSSININNDNSSSKNIHICALTGCAANLLNCNAKTIHSWAGIGLGNQPIDFYYNKIKRNEIIRTRWQTIDVLVIDEISMMSMYLFELLNDIAQYARKNKKPFGGIQLLFSGDFYQLPPVNPMGSNIDKSKFCFESKLWNDTFTPLNTVVMDKQFRQINDDKYATILTQIRNGNISKSTYNTLTNEAANYENKIANRHAEDADTSPTLLLPTKAKVNKHNALKLSKLPNKNHTTFSLQKYTDLPIIPADFQENYKKIINKPSDTEIDVELSRIQTNLIIDDNIQLTIGAQVMCTVNICAIDEITENAVSLFNGSQGVITNIQQRKWSIKKKETKMCVLVRFKHGCVWIEPHVWQSETIPGIGIVGIPLILSWAITIHKGQGMSLNECEIDIGNSIFERGQSYVALSRIRSLSGLYLREFNITKIQYDLKAQEYMKILMNSQTLYDKKPICSSGLNTIIQKLLNKRTLPTHTPIKQSVQKTELPVANAVINTVPMATATAILTAQPVVATVLNETENSNVFGGFACS